VAVGEHDKNESGHDELLERDLVGLHHGRRLLVARLAAPDQYELKMLREDFAVRRQQLLATSRAVCCAKRRRACLRRFSEVITCTASSAFFVAQATASPIRFPISLL